MSEADREYRDLGGDISQMKKKIVDSLVYLRERVSVPSDFTYPQAKYLRAYINWLVDIIEQQ